MIIKTLAVLLNSNLQRDQIISFLNTIQSNSLCQYLFMGDIYSGVATKTINQLPDMIIYGHMCRKIKNIETIESISRDEADKTLKNT